MYIMYCTSSNVRDSKFFTISQNEQVSDFELLLGDPITKKYLYFI